MRDDVIQIGKRSIGVGQRVFIIAEAGVNHNGDLRKALKLVDAAAKAGADAVKFQTFSADRLVTRLSPKAKYQRETTNSRESQYEMLKKLELSHDAHRKLKSRAEERGVAFLSTPFDAESADFLESLGVPAFKIGSGELTDLPLLAHIARKGKPMFLSTGMSTMEEVSHAVQTVQKEGLREIVLLHCVSAYPAPVEDVNLRAMQTLLQAFGMPVGYSDHTRGIQVAIAAVALGAAVLEKHLTTNRGLPGPDHRASLEPAELKALVQAVREIERTLGDGIKRPMASEQDTRRVARKSLVAACDLPTGTVIQKNHLIARRPGTGIPPGESERLIGRTLTRALAADELLRWEDLT